MLAQARCVGRALLRANRERGRATAHHSAFEAAVDERAIARAVALRCGRRAGRLASLQALIPIVVAAAAAVGAALEVADASTLRQSAYMAKTASITVRIPQRLKEDLERRAVREHRSLSAQIEHELTLAVAAEGATGLAKAGTFLGRFAGKKMPSDADFREARSLAWSRLAKD
jgi:hypothetical protein